MSFIGIFSWCYSHNASNLLSRRWNSTVQRIDKVLIANRGEIACRVIRSARKLGVRTVAVYSEADEQALHVRRADEAYNIGPAPAAQSYLRADKILEVAKLSNSRAIHPGYGFLSENVEFAEACQKHGIAFIGPPATAIRDMGIKSTSKAIMAAAGVPVIEGYHGEDQSLHTLKAEAQRIGFPVMVKAVRGGGGKGMRIALTESDFEEALESARTEAQKAFGDSVVLLERFVTEPRHVEVQVFADAHGNAVHLFERDCSVQRRHQKIIEEAPAPGLTLELRAELGAAAVRAAKAVGYVGAGTVEFILDRHTNKFHFMEMNTRLQVEHPITEMITGTDLVEWQLKIAAGERLPVTQEEIGLSGHAFEARIYAEDPSGGFLPGAGPLLHLTTPASRPDVRIETGVQQGDSVSVHYDPMIAKLVVWGESRSEALAKLRANLLEYNIAGVETNVNFLLSLIEHPEFQLGNVHTNFIKDHYDSLFKNDEINQTQLIQAALTIVLQDELRNVENAIKERQTSNPFVAEMGFRPNRHYTRQILLIDNKGNERKALVKFLQKNRFEISLDCGNKWYYVEGELEQVQSKLVLKTVINNKREKICIFSNSEMLVIFDYFGKTQFAYKKPKYLTENDSTISSTNINKAITPMPGILDKIMVNQGDKVKKGDSLFVLIAMKMEHLVKAEKDAIIANVYYKAGDNVPKDTTVIQFKENNN